jgi:hypothetical protein
VAVREISLPAGFCADLLFVRGKAAGVIEAKRAKSCTMLPFCSNVMSVHVKNLIG